MSAQYELPIPLGRRPAQSGEALRQGPIRLSWTAVADLTQAALVRRRVQLLGALLIAVLAPAVLAAPWTGPYHASGVAALARGSLGFGNSIVETALAMLAGFIALQQMRAHPGTQSFGLIIYPFALSYGALGVFLLFMRVDYSRYELLSSFGLAIAWFLWVQRVTSRKTEWRLGLVPGIPQRALPKTQGVTWLPLDEPEAPAIGVTAVVADLNEAPSPAWERYLARAALDGVPVYDLRQVNEWLTGQVKFEHMSDNTLSATLSRMVYVRAKWLLDLSVAAAAAPVFAIIIAAAAIAIRLESPGPVFFRQVRMGHRGRTFTIFKLRSMWVGAARGEQFTSDADPRITRVGAFIRKYRIDELPQIWNITLGQMSWIGPRPEAVMLANWYEQDVPFYCYRHMVRPGITGWAQVHQGNVAKPDAAAEKLRYDFYYIKNLSPWLDLLIVAKTVKTILTGFGSK